MNSPKGKIYLIPTIISENTEEKHVAPEVLNMVLILDYFLVENIRTARRYISNLMKLIPEKDRKPIASLRFELVDKKTTDHEVHQLLVPVMDGQNCGVLSESGCPGIADPGSVIVKSGHNNNLTIIPLPGPSSIFLALMASGMSGQNFVFHGYLPIDKKTLIKKIKKLEVDSILKNQTQIFIETPYRNQKMLEALLNTGRPDTNICIATDITGANEKIITQNILHWKEQKINLPKLPTVFLLNR